MAGTVHVWGGGGDFFDGLTLIRSRKLQSKLSRKGYNRICTCTMQVLHVVRYQNYAMLSTTQNLH